MSVHYHVCAFASGPVFIVRTEVDCTCQLLQPSTMQGVVLQGVVVCCCTATIARTPGLWLQAVSQSEGQGWHAWQQYCQSYRHMS